MEFTVAYQGRSGLSSSGAGLALSLAPNLRRDRVSFAGDLLFPLRFREAASALHAVVVSDLKCKAKDRSAYQAYLTQVRERENTIRKTAAAETRERLRAEAAAAMPEGFEAQFQTLRARYWRARQRYGDYLANNDPMLWRQLMPCDPVITVAPDLLFYECFSKDESSYACLTIEREAFASQGDVALGTTNVDYSQALYDELQRLRTYRRTRFAIDPAGFEVTTGGGEGLREEKIELPPSWLRGFMQLQAAMSVPRRQLLISREALYNILGHLKRHRTRTGPRALRFELKCHKPVIVVLEPWEVRIKLHDLPYVGSNNETIRVWGRERLLTLDRLLPLTEYAFVFLLGTGLPSFWSVGMGEMRLLLGLSGWTANDWTSGGGALLDLAPPVEPSADLLGDIAATFRSSPSLTFEQVRQRTGAESTGFAWAGDSRPRGGGLSVAAGAAGRAGAQAGEFRQSGGGGRAGVVPQGTGGGEPE